MNNLLAFTDGLLFIGNEQVVSLLMLSAVIDSNQSNLVLLKPYYVTGFSDAESCFTLSIYKNSELRTG
jgi:hypothetical protein